MNVLILFLGYVCAGLTIFNLPALVFVALGGVSRPCGGVCSEAGKRGDRRHADVGRGRLEHEVHVRAKLVGQGECILSALNV